MVRHLRSTQVGPGFTLVELLSAIAIIALLIGLLIPALGESRRAAQTAVTLSNLKQLALSQLIYSPENRDALFNPIDPDRSAEVLADTWAMVINPQMSASFGDRDYASLLLSSHWTGLMMDYIDPGHMNSQVLFSPGDRAIQSRFRQNSHILADYQMLGSVTYDTSYWTSPSLWTRPAIWSTSGAVRIDPQPEKALDYWRRNRIEQIASPQAKVMLWERFDCSRTSRLSGLPGGGRVPLPPNWNNPESTARVATMDGAVLSVSMRSLADHIARSEQTVPGPAPFRPCGEWDVPDQVLTRYEIQDGLENGGAENPGRYPAYFWATRDGVRGRDLNR